LKEKIVALKASLQTEYKESCTFSPQVTKKSKQINSDKPAFQRLYEKGQQYRRAQEEKKEV
jgi:hypothetical protein